MLLQVCVKEDLQECVWVSEEGEQIEEERGRVLEALSCEKKTDLVFIPLMQINDDICMYVSIDFTK